MTKLIFSLMLLVFTVAPSAQAMTEVYKGQSAIGDEDSGKACTLTLERDEKTAEILTMKLRAPARLQKMQSGEEEASEEITAGKETADLSRLKKFSEFRFQKLSDVQGEGFMLRGEKKGEKLFIHFDIHEGTLVGVELAQRRRSVEAKNKLMSERTFAEKTCSGLKKL